MTKALAMKIENKTTFRALPFRQIVTRLGNRLGRVTPGRLHIDICCDVPEGKACKHGSYLLGAISANKEVEDYTGQAKIADMYLWFPRQHEHITSRDVAYALDNLMQRVGFGPPGRIQDRVAFVRDYQWADALPLGEVKILARPRRTLSPDQKLLRRQAKLEVLIKRWKRARSAADYNVRKYEAEGKALHRKIGKEA